MDYAYNQKKYDQRSEKEHDIFGMCRPFRRFLSQNEFFELVEKVAKGIEITERIEYLQKLRKKGLKTLEEV